MAWMPRIQKLRPIVLGPAADTDVIAASSDDYNGSVNVDYQNGGAGEVGDDVALLEPTEDLAPNRSGSYTFGRNLFVRFLGQPFLDMNNTGFPYGFTFSVTCKLEFLDESLSVIATATQVFTGEFNQTASGAENITQEWSNGAITYSQDMLPDGWHALRLDVSDHTVSPSGSYNASTWVYTIDIAASAYVPLNMGRAIRI